MDKILIVKTSALGDVIHAYPVVTYLRKKFPHAKIDWVVEAQCQNLVQAHPEVNKAIPIATKAWRRSPFSQETIQEIKAFSRHLREEKYDVVFDLQGNIKSGIITAAARSRYKVGFGIQSVPEKPNVLFTNKRFNPPPNGNIRQDYLAVVSSFFGEELPLLECEPVQLRISEKQLRDLQAILHKPQLHNGPYVMVCAGSAWPNKQLTVEALGDFLDLLRRDIKCSFLFSWGSLDEMLIAGILHGRFARNSFLMDKLNLAALQNLMGMCQLVVAVDSLPLHLAGTTNVPTFSVFGASSAHKYNPPGHKHIAFQGQCPYGRTFTKRCPILRTCPTGACIRSLTGDVLFTHYRAL
ncbi:MAG: lipopolysaccharide heptosyltransferase I [Parachlamydiaceae bacterium]